jgi:very-short-patch-repair endonuclease
MNVERAPKNPSPLAGEDAARSAAGEGLGGAVILRGVGSRGPSHGRSLRSRPTSPARGEGKGGGSSLTKPEMRRRARALRINMTNAERKLRYALRDRRFAGFKFRRQVPLGPFIADFVCFEERLVIEVDGGQHAGSLQDRRRDRWFAANGYRVLRFWNNEVLSNLEGVMAVLAQTLNMEWS